jgi:aspartate/methionine/tyrosine aminotransferase
MTINVFKLEEYLARYEFNTPYLLCCSDAESFSLKEIISMGDSEDLLLWDNLRLGYTEAPGLPALRHQIAQSFYPNLNQNNILCFAGAEDGIFCTLHTLCTPEDHAIVLTPCYQSLMEIPKLRQCQVTPLPLKEENQWRIDLETIKGAIQKNTKVVIINFPHNPTGQVIRQHELLELIRILDRCGIWLFSDEAYRLLGTPEDGWADPAACLYDKAISLGVMSKSFGMAGLRIGWISCQNQQILRKIEQMKHYTSICNSALSEIISLIALKNKEILINRNNQIVQQNLRLLDRFFEDYHPLFSWVKPQGGCVGFVNYTQTESIDTLSKHLAEQAGVLLMPASVFDYQTNHFRIGFGRKNMPEALERFKNFIRR